MPQIQQVMPEVQQVVPQFQQVMPQFQQIMPQIQQITPPIAPAGAALTSVFSHVLASLSTEAQARFPGPQVNINIQVPGVESLFGRMGAVYTFAGPLAGDRDFAAFLRGGTGRRRRENLWNTY